MISKSTIIEQNGILIATRKREGKGERSDRGHPSAVCHRTVSVVPLPTTVSYREPLSQCRDTIDTRAGGKVGFLLS